MKDFSIDPYTKDYTLTSGQFALSNSLMNNICLSLAVARGSWPFNPEFGSRLHLLERSKITPHLEADAKAYCIESLAWMVDAGRAEFEVQTTLDAKNMRLLCAITARATGVQITYDHFIEVR